MSKKKPHQESDGQRVKQEIQRAIVFINSGKLYAVKVKKDQRNEQKKAPLRGKRSCSNFSR